MEADLSRRVTRVGKKDPIPFQLKKKQRSQAKKAASSRRPKGPGSHPNAGGEIDDVRLYWQHFVHEPFAGPGRFLWTERMLWGNALLAGLAVMAGVTLEFGFHLLNMISVFINVFFLFMLAYYLVPWVADWIFRRMHVYTSTSDGLKLEIIVLSGWLVVASLIRVVPYYAPIPYWLAMVGFAVLLARAIHRRVRTPWTQTVLAAGGGMAALAVIMLILGKF